MAAGDPGGSLGRLGSGPRPWAAGRSLSGRVQQARGPGDSSCQRPWQEERRHCLWFPLLPGGQVALDTLVWTRPTWALGELQVGSALLISGGCECMSAGVRISIGTTKTVLKNSPEPSLSASNAERDPPLHLAGLHDTRFCAQG